MRIAYFDVFAGASGDMVLGALLDAGAPLEEVRATLQTLPLTGWQLLAEPGHRGAVAGTRARVVVDPMLPQPARRLGEVLALVEQSALPPRVRRDTAAVFRLLAEAEGKVHRMPPASVHFHEVGAVDSLVDIVGAIVALDLLGVEQVFVSSLPLGGGMVTTEHGALPVPAPATVQLLAQVGAPVRASEGSAARQEMVTPTAAALFAALGTFQLPEIRLEAVGYGLGARSLSDLPNALRVLVGERVESDPALVLLETNIDDQPAEQLAYVLERLLAAGARDAWFTPIQMKKNRPAIQLSAIVNASDEAMVAGLLLRETTTLGVRVLPLRRHEADRRQVDVETPLGHARLKLKLLAGKVAGIAPEFEDCRALAERHGLPLGEVYRIVAEAGRSLLGAPPSDRA
jgi:uncharacterized protein (TIGR00299 family) protein